MNLIFLILLAITTMYINFVSSKTISVNPYNNVNVIENETKELPTQEDFNAYMDSLRGVIGFCYENKEDIDMNLAFGLFLVHVNLETVLHRKSLPKDLAQELKGMSGSVKALLDFFRTMVLIDNEPTDQTTKRIATLFWDAVPWVEGVEDLSNPLPLDTNWQTPRFRSWEEYQRAILDLDHTAMPGPKESDMCLSSLASGRVNRTCSLHPTCLYILKEGSDYGYSLTHRLLLLLLAQHTRECSLPFPGDPRAMLARLCSIAYGEAQGIADNHFGDFIDLFMEQISVCSIAGFGQFVRRSWLAAILGHQHAEGCFGQAEARGGQRPMNLQKKFTKRRWALQKTEFNHDSLDLICNGHVTAVAAGAISAGNLQKNFTKRRWALQKTEFNHDSLDLICNGHVTAVAAGAVSAGVRLFIETTYFDN